ncbi:MAG: hypothetical protein CVU89_13705 [Firmicutes bacterium HGW-Firmicutes-14]|nr:MAG: hypothetical protein CVU89_13705 [Firmicutes bacterium HGW-Firmicutes-14]
MSVIKKTVTGILSLFLLAGIVAGVLQYKANKSAIAESSDPARFKKQMKELGLKRKAISNNPNKDVPVLKIGDTEYTLEQFLDRKYGYQVSDPKVSLDKITDSLKRQEVLMNEAKKRNVYPSKQDVKNYMIQQRKMIEESNNPEEMEAYVEGLGITLDEYWNEWAVPQYERELAMINAGKSITEDIIQGPTETPKEFIQRKDKAFKDFMDSKTSEIEMEMLRQDLI